MAGVNKVVSWKSPHPSGGVVDVLQSSPFLLDYLTNERSLVEGRRPPSAHTKLFILIPGNPGLVQFYTDFCDCMHRRRFDVLVMGLAGHSLRDQNDGRYFSLQEQIDTLDAFMQAVLIEPVAAKYRGNVYVGGHSIGAFIGLHAVARYPQVKRFFGLCPVITRIRESPGGRLSCWTDLPGMCLASTHALSAFALLPERIRLLVIKCVVPTMEESLRVLLAHYVSRVAIMNAGHLALDELRSVGRPDVPLLQSLQEKMVLYYVPTDSWAPPIHGEEIHQYCPRLAARIVETDESVPHAWCLQHTEKVIETAILPYV